MHTLFIVLLLLVFLTGVMVGKHFSKKTKIPDEIMRKILDEVKKENFRKNYLCGIFFDFILWYVGVQRRENLWQLVELMKETGIKSLELEPIFGAVKQFLGSAYERGEFTLLQYSQISHSIDELEKKIKMKMGA